MPPGRGAGAGGRRRGERPQKVKQIGGEADKRGAGEGLGREGKCGAGKYLSVGEN
jgi:hypothetical protein